MVDMLREQIEDKAQGLSAKDAEPKHFIKHINGLNLDGHLI